MFFVDTTCYLLMANFDKTMLDFIDLVYYQTYFSKKIKLNIGK